MLNVKTTINGQILTIEIDLSKSYGTSASGKTIVIASTKGNKELDTTGVYLGLNAYKYPPRGNAPARSSVLDNLGLD